MRQLGVGPESPSSVSVSRVSHAGEDAHRGEGALNRESARGADGALSRFSKCSRLRSLKWVSAQAATALSTGGHLSLLRWTGAGFAQFALWRICLRVGPRKPFAASPE